MSHKFSRIPLDCEKCKNHTLVKNICYMVVYLKCKKKLLHIILTLIPATQFVRTIITVSSSITAVRLWDAPVVWVTSKLVSITNSTTSWDREVRGEGWGWEGGGKEERRYGGRKGWEEGKVGEETEGERMKEVGKEEEGSREDKSPSEEVKSLAKHYYHKKGTHIHLINIGTHFDCKQCYCYRENFAIHTMGCKGVRSWGSQIHFATLSTSLKEVTVCLLESPWTLLLWYSRCLWSTHAPYYNRCYRTSCIIAHFLSIHKLNWDPFCKMPQK